jgi:hypothetical protein
LRLQLLCEESVPGRRNCAGPPVIRQRGRDDRAVAMLRPCSENATHVQWQDRRGATQIRRKCGDGPEVVKRRSGWGAAPAQWERGTVSVQPPDIGSGHAKDRLFQ